MLAKLDEIETNLDGMHDKIEGLFLKSIKAPLRAFMGEVHE